MKNILCYGDSNTYGFIAGRGERYNEKTRWTRLLQKQLGDNYYVIEEGLNGRTTVFDDPLKNHLNGSELLEVCLSAHQPLDLVILMLGTNDIKVAFQAGPTEIAEGMENLVKILRNQLNYDREILIVAPIHISDSIVNSEYCESFGGMRGVEISKQLAKEYQKIANKYQCSFLDAADYAKADDTDAIHLDEKGHASLAKALQERVITII